MTITKIAADVSAWVWDTYGKVIFDDVVKKVKGKWDRFNWIDASKKYRERIIDMLGTTKVWGLTEPFILDDIFVDVFVLRKITSSRLFDSKSVQGGKSSAYSYAHRLEREKTESALRIVTQENYLFLWGRPGSGKTTFLKHIALLSAKEKIDRIPIFISLRDLSGKKLNLLSAVIKQFDICAFPDAKPFVEKVLKEGRAILLLDGLDEVAEKEGFRAMVIKELEEFVNRYPLCKYIVTCRNGFTGIYFERFTQLEIADIQNQYIENFVSKWFVKDPQKGASFIRNLFIRPNLQDLARLPLFLSLLCFVFNEKSRFPESRIELYNDVFNILLSEWDLARNIIRDDIAVIGRDNRESLILDLEAKFQILSNIALDTFKEDEIIFSEEYLIKTLLETYSNINGRKTIKDLEVQHGILIEIAQRKYSFAYLNFQEYLAARHIKKNMLDHYLSGKSFTPKWREVIIFASGLGCKPEYYFDDDLIDAICSDNNLERVAKTILLVRSFDDDKIREFIDNNGVKMLASIVYGNTFDSEMIRQSIYLLKNLIPSRDIDQLKSSHPALDWAFNEDINKSREALINLLKNITKESIKLNLPFIPPCTIIGETDEEKLISYEKWITSFEQSKDFDLLLWNSEQIETLIYYVNYQIDLMQECKKQRAGRNDRGNYFFDDL